MLWRIAARIVTGPLAFLVAGVVDVAVFVLGALYARARERLESRRR